MQLRHALGIFSRRRHRELSEIYLESERIDAILEKVVRPDSNCVDIGCHYGSMLSSLCRLAPRGRHIAFEAIPQKVRFLKRKFREVDVRETALSDQIGTTRFFINRKASGFSGIVQHGTGEFREIEVSCSRIDDVLPRDRRFSFVKIDVEGAELPVIRGATQFLLRDRPAILFECGPSAPVAFGYTPGELYAMFTDQCGYSVYFLKDFIHGGRPVDRATFEAALVYPYQAFNWMARPRD